MRIVLALELRLSAFNQLIHIDLAVRQQREVQLCFLRWLARRRIASGKSGLPRRVVPRLRDLYAARRQAADAGMQGLSGYPKLARRLCANTIRSSESGNYLSVTCFYFWHF
jgi:hypothetical protein